MTLSTWWSGDPLPDLPSLPTLAVSRRVASGPLAHLNQIPIEEVRARRAEGHRAYVALLQGRPVAYGWVATAQASIGELGLRFSLPVGDRYLWDFATLPSWQGRGLYPRLLQGILRAESRRADRFWIIHAPENLPSGAGMFRAGFRPVGELSFERSGAVALAPLAEGTRVQHGAALLNLPLAGSPLSPCWRCRAAPHPCGCADLDEPAPGTCVCAVTLKSPVANAA